jgi:predicted transcriptional regulator
LKFLYKAFAKVIFKPEQSLGKGAVMLNVSTKMLANYYHGTEQAEMQTAESREELEEK